MKDIKQICSGIDCGWCLELNCPNETNFTEEEQVLEKDNE